MKNSKTLLAAAALCALFGAHAVLAQQVQPAAADDGRFKKMDSNGDGVIDKTEAAKFPHLAQRFDQLDTNKDGKLQPSELPTRGMRGPGMRGPGSMNPAEMQAMRTQRMDKVFAEIDTNKDGKLSRAELQAFQAKRQAEHAKRQAERAKRAPQDFDARFKRMDVNGDGMITKEEFEKRGLHGGGHGMHGRGWGTGKDMPPKQP